MRYVNKALSCIFLIAISVASISTVAAEDDILDFLPAILSNVEKRPPPPARWRVANDVACSSFESNWRVTDGTDERISDRFSQFSESRISSFVTREPGVETFSWVLRTTFFSTTCGTFRGTFTQDLKPRFDYTFVLELGSGNEFEVRTIETRRP